VTDPEGQAPWPPPQVAVLPGGRLHLQHGPIDLVIGTQGSSEDRRSAHQAAVSRFSTILGELAAELPALRRPLAGDAPPAFASPVACRMVAACWPHRSVFITPMAAVAGAVADEIAAAMQAAAPALASLYVNNGGDIAVRVAEGEHLSIGLVPDLAKATPDGLVAVDHVSGIGGIATSGWRGRSFSRGIADAVTVLAGSAAEADAAATVIANAVDAEDRAIARAPADTLDPDSDLGAIAVTVAVGPLPEGVRDRALAAGVARAEALLASGRILGVCLALQGGTRMVGGAADYSAASRLSAMKRVASGVSHSTR
jgi:uncharacterized protein